LLVLLVFGILYGIGAVIESLEYDFPLIGYLNNNYLYFAIAINIFFPLYKIFLKKFDKHQDIDLLFKIFKSKNKVIIGIVWGIAVLFLSFDILGIQLVWEPNDPDYDILYIGFFTAFLTVFFITLLAYLINKAKPIEKQIIKVVLRNSLLASAVISFGIWSVQFIIIEMFLSRLFGLTIIQQDLRVIIIVILGIFIVSHFNLLRIKFIPEASLKSKKRVLEAIKEKEKSIQQFSEEEPNVDTQNIDVSFNEHENGVYIVESVSNKFYHFLLNKLRILRSSDDDAYLERKNIRIFKNLIVASLWIIVFVIISINLFQLLSNLNPIFEIFFLSVQYASFMVFIDISITLIFTKLTPIKKRIPKEIFRDSIFTGGIILVWIFVVPLFLIYYYFFTGIYQNTISDFFSTIISLIIIFIVGISITRWLSRKKGFDSSLRKAIIMNLLFFIINIPFSLFFVFLFGDNLLNDILIIVIDIAIGSVIIMMLYSKGFKRSIKFAFNLEVISFFLGIKL